MKRNHFSVVILACLSLVACRAPQASTTAPSAAESPSAKDEVALSADQQAASMITTKVATLSQQPDTLRAKGRIVLDDDKIWKVGVRTIGSVISVYVGLGDRVHKGQVLARYHADEVRDSRAQFRTAVAELDRVKAVAAQAQRNVDRAEKLLELRAGSVQQVEQARQDLVSAQAAVKKAQIEVDRGRDLLEDDLRVPADPPANRQDETEDNVPILAPADGYILEKNVTPGKTLDLSAVTFVIGDLSRVWMLASVRQEDLGKLRVNQSAFVSLPGEDHASLPGQASMTGKITNLGQEFDPSTRVMQIRIELANPSGRLRPEMLADAEIPFGANKPVMLLPSDAIQQVNGQDVVFVRTAADRFSIRPVQVGETREGSVPIVEGVHVGDQVVVAGSFILKSQLLKSSLENE
jgi:membrane fusion protein, heavy metal efflux system